MSRAVEVVRVLLVEDNPGDADLVREFVASAGMPPVELEHAERLTDALARLRHGNVDVVLLDLSLPDAGGVDALQRVRTAAPGVPVVVLTGADEELGERALGAGAQDYLRKGEVHGEVLGRALRYAMQRHDFAERERELRQEHDARVAAEEAVAVRDEFIAIAAHELRTPLTVLELQVGQLERRAQGAPEDADCATCAEKLVRVTRQVGRLKRLVTALLDVTRITSRRVALERSDVDLVAVAGRAIDELSAAARRAGCAVALDAPAPVVGAWDASGLEQILTSLLENAIKYGARRPVDVTIRARDGAAVLAVRDRGIGIAPEDAARIFGRFERAVSFHHYGGLGLGLFIARHVADAHGGTIAVESAPGEGSTFTLTLPLATSASVST